MEFSQHPRGAALTMESVSDTASDHHALSTGQRKRTEGIALIAMLLLSTVLFISVMAISSTVMLSSRQTTTDQELTLRAQYAAEAGLSRAKTGFSDVTYLISKMVIPTSAQGNALEAKVKNFCGAGKSYNYPVYSRWTPDQRRNGVLLCDVVGKNGNGQYSMFTAWVPTSEYPAGSPPPGQYWQEVFAPKSLRSVVKIQSENGLDVYYQIGYGIEPRTTLVMIPNSWYRLVFDSASSTSTGYVQRTSDGKRLATKLIGNESPSQVYIDIRRKSLSYYGQFFNQWPGVYMTGGEVSDGPFHSNEPIRLMKWQGTYPQFLDGDVSIAGKESQTWNGSIGYGKPATSTEKSQTFLGGEPRFEAENIPLPQNPYSLQRAAMGGDATDSDSQVTKNETTAAYGKDLTSSSSNQGIYYSSGTSSTSNTGTAFAGGIYVNGNASVKLSTSSGDQVITVTQGTQTLTFKESSSGTWTVNNGTSTKTMSNDFNGAIYVNGNITSLGGDGTNTPDIAANSQLTLAATGDVTVKQSYTYTDDPLTDPYSQNVVGLLTTGGNIIADGPTNQDLVISGSLMATGEDKGVTANIVPKGLVNGRYPQMKIIGGQIVDSALATESGSNGYKTNFVYDERLRNTLAPPFFPIEESWTGDGSTLADGYQNAIWQVAAGQ